MRESLIGRLELMVANTQQLKKKFRWKSMQLKRLAALLYAAENKEVDYNAIQESLELIKRKTGAFSTFRGNSVLGISALLSLSENKDAQLANTLTVYDMMKASKFRASDYLVVAAYQIAAGTAVENYQQTINRSIAFYDGMKSKHPFITGRNDYIFAAMLGLSDVDIGSGLARIEQLHTAFKPMFRSGDGVQALAQILALSGETEGLESRVHTISDGFRKNRLRLDRENTLSSLGVLALLPIEVEEIVNEVTGAFHYLREQKGFSGWSIGKQELLLLTIALVGYDLLDGRDPAILSTISTSLTNIIIAQQTAMIAAAAAASGAAAASSSSS